MDFDRILVYILSGALAFLLILAIIATALLIKIMKNVKHVTEQAGSLAESFVAVGEAIKKTAVPTAVSGMVANAIGNFVGGKSNKKEDKGE